MDAHWQNIFYIIGSIALILVSLTVIAIFYLIYRIKRMTDHVIHHSRSLVKIWERLAITRAVVRILKLIL